ncbi:MAG: hypothetical protein LLG00_06170, partial [Planctomycetaceae bacterium]|nr:hypothetical protein [Planctomycetaceae bacterium]
VDITRMDPLRRDFKCVEIALPDHTIELDLVTTPYKGATAEEINEFLVQHLAPEQIEITIARDALVKRSHVEKQLKAARAAQRQVRICGGIALPLLVATLAWMAIDRGVAQAIATTAMCALVWVPLFIGVYPSIASRIKELESRLAALGDNPAEEIHRRCQDPPRGGL